jgi:hypothetical protein
MIRSTTIVSVLAGVADPGRLISRRTKTAIGDYGDS